MPIKRHAHQAPSRRERLRRFELAGELEGFWFQLGGVTMPELLELQRAQARLQAAGTGDEGAAETAEQVLRQVCDRWIVDHNFVDVNDEPLPVGAGLYAAIDAQLLAAVFAQVQTIGQLPNASSGSTPSGSAPTAP
jgi:hypothetical protein